MPVSGDCDPGYWAVSMRPSLSLSVARLQIERGKNGEFHEGDTLVRPTSLQFTDSKGALGSENEGVASGCPFRPVPFFFGQRRAPRDRLTDRRSRRRLPLPRLSQGKNVRSVMPAPQKRWPWRPPLLFPPLQDESLPRRVSNSGWRGD